MELFIKHMPKIELHAHLNGSLNTQSIRELGLQIYGDNSEQFLDKIQNFIQFLDNGDKLQKCFQKFAFMHELTSTRKGLQLATEMVLRDFESDNVCYLELRSTPKANDNMTRREYLEIILKVLENTKGSHTMLTKLLVSIDRSQGIEVASEIVDLTIEMNQMYPKLVKGIDLSGNPAKGNFNDFKGLLQKAKNANLKLALHCAEIPNETEAQAMLDFNFDRCGHGTYLTEDQLAQCRKQNIAMECCLTSNVKCGTVKSYDEHHFRNSFEKNIKTVLCTDDCGVFDTSLTQEFSIASKIFDLKKQNIYELCINAIDASFAEIDEKFKLKQKIDSYFILHFH